MVTNKNNLADNFSLETEACDSKTGKYIKIISSTCFAPSTKGIRHSGSVA
jgi:hypothetical protein